MVRYPPQIRTRRAHHIIRRHESSFNATLLRFGVPRLSIELVGSWSSTRWT